MRTIEITRFGGPECLELSERPNPVPRLGQVVVVAPAREAERELEHRRTGAAFRVGAPEHANDFRYPMA